MFTGIVEEMGVVRAVEFTGSVNSLVIECNKVLQDIKLGDSIAVNGVCLTVSRLGNNWFGADVMPETLRRTSLSELKIGHKVNIEPALKLGARLGGHLVSGHIDGVGVITRITEEYNAVWIVVKAHEELMKYVVMKGSVAVEGTSLTVASVSNNEFGVSLIPTTRFLTTLGHKKLGDKVNIECDIISKYIEKLIVPDRNLSSNIDTEFLRSNGFI